MHTSNNNFKKKRFIEPINIFSEFLFLIKLQKMRICIKIIKIFNTDANIINLLFIQISVINCMNKK